MNYQMKTLFMMLLQIASLGGASHVWATTFTCRQVDHPSRFMQVELGEDQFVSKFRVLDRMESGRWRNLKVDQIWRKSNPPVFLNYVTSQFSFRFKPDGHGADPELIILRATGDEHLPCHRLSGAELMLSLGASAETALGCCNVCNPSCSGNPHIPACPHRPGSCH